MEQDCGSCFPRAQFDWQSHNLSYMGSALPLGQGSTITPLMNPDANMLSNNGSLLMNPFTGLSGSPVGDLTDSCGWLYCLPRRHAFPPAISSMLYQKDPNAVEENVEKDSAPKLESRCAQKKFLVFDQSGDQTSLIFSSGLGAPVRCFTSWTPNPMGASNLHREDLGIKGHTDFPFDKPILPEDFAEKNETDLHSEMHEDTDELNALLYSEDDSDYEDDDEVTSTGHSPSTMTTHNKQDFFEELMEEVASTDGCSSRKRKLFLRGCADVPSLTSADDSKPWKSVGATACDNDAESKCANGANVPFEKMGTPDWGSKRIRKDMICETASILQSIIPGGKSLEDPILVFDEAIKYLKRLKHNAEVLGLDSR